MYISGMILLEANQSNGGFSSIIMIVAMIAIFYFFMIRPQQKKQKELKKQREQLTVGSKVVTAGGIHGRIKETGDVSFMIEVAPGMCIKVDKNSIYPLEEATPKQKK